MVGCVQPVEKFFFGVDVVPRGHAKWNAVPVVKWREAFEVLRRPVWLVSREQRKLV